MVFVTGCAANSGEHRAISNEISRQCIEAGNTERTVSFAKCKNKKLEAEFIKINYPYWDLVDLAAAYRVYLTEQFQNGQVTEAESDLLWADFKTKFAAEEQNRATNAAYARAASAQGTAALIQSWGIMQQAMQPPQPVQPNPSSVTCRQRGAYTDCNVR